jgi:hypothetical protein
VPRSALLSQEDTAICKVVVCVLLAARWNRPGRRVKAKSLRVRFAVLDTAATAEDGSRVSSLSM